LRSIDLFRFLTNASVTSSLTAHLNTVSHMGVVLLGVAGGVYFRGTGSALTGGVTLGLGTLTMFFLMAYFAIVLMQVVHIAMHIPLGNSTACTFWVPPQMMHLIMIRTSGTLNLKWALRHI